MPEGRVTAELRAQAAARARHACECCRTPEICSPGAFTVDHIKPKSALGTSELANLAWACAGCNAAKHVRQKATDPKSAEAVPLFHPRRQRWEAHFVWSADGLQILGLTATGRATVEALEMNRPSLMHLRELLNDTGRHPRFEV